MGITAEGARSSYAADAVLGFHGVDVEYKTEAGRVPALRNLSMTIHHNEFVTAIGPSGCGKSTLLKVASRVLSPTRGTVTALGASIEEADLEGQLGYVFQKPLLLPWRTALGNVLFPLEIMHGRTSTAHEQQARSTLRVTGLEGFEDARPHQLSGGMQQRVSLARALVIQPQLFLMDEPFAALDEITRESMQEELLRIWQADRTTILFITHNIEEAVLLSDRVVVLSGRPGTVVHEETIPLQRPRGDEVRRAPEFIDTVQKLRAMLRTSTGARP